MRYDTEHYIGIIDEQVFIDNRVLRTVVISEGVKEIGNCVFYSCDNLVLSPEHMEKFYIAYN